MPSVVAGAVVSAIGLGGIAGTVASVALGGVASIAMQSFVAKPRTQKLSSSQSGTRVEMTRNASQPRRVVYGRARLSGPLAFAATTDGENSTKNAYLHLVIPLADYGLSEIATLYINDEAIKGEPALEEWVYPQSDSRFFNKKTAASEGHYAQWQYRLGDEDQLALRALSLRVAGWSDAHRLRGIAYLYVQLLWNSSVWSGGLPNISAEVHGRKIYDPRTGQTVWSNNPALIIRDYLLADFGLGCESSEIDEDNFIIAANLCDEEVIAEGTQTQKRYSCDGVFALDEKPIDVIEQLLTSCYGQLVYSEGRYRLYPAAYRIPVLELNADYLRDSVTVRPVLPWRERPNTVRGTFIYPDKGWQKTDFSPVIDSVALLADGGRSFSQDLDLGFTIDPLMAERLALLHLRRQRQTLTVDMPATLSALAVSVMQPIMLTLPQLGWDKKVFLPTAWRLSPEGGVDLTLIEDDPSLYAWAGTASLTTSVAVTPPRLPSLYPNAPHLRIHDELIRTTSGNSLRLIVDCSEAEDAFVIRYEVEYKREDEAHWHAAGAGRRTVIRDILAGETYVLRARSHTLMGTSSAWAEQCYTITLADVTPQDVIGFKVNQLGTLILLSWEETAGETVDHYRLRWSPQIIGATWSSALDVVSNCRDPRLILPARAGSYMIKAIDLLGRESANETLVNVPLSLDASGFTVGFLQENPSFAGAKSNCTINVTGQLIIDSLAAFDAQTMSFESASGLIDSAGGGASPEGIYHFASSLDLGARYIVRLAANLAADVLDLVADIDGASSFFDSREGLFDGSAPATVDVKVEVAITADDPLLGSAVWSAWQSLHLGDVAARGLKFRARLISQNAMATPALNSLGITAELPQRSEQGAGVSAPTTGMSVIFASPFKIAPAVQVTGQTLQTGDYASITDISRTGFTVQFRNAAGNGVARIFDWQAQGYGQQI